MWSNGGSERAAVDTTTEFLLRCLERNAKCLIAYLFDRVERLESVRWDLGSVLPDSTLANISPQELQYFGGYSRLVGKYSSQIGLDLTAYMRPPKEIYVQVRCVEEVGEIATESGMVSLQKNSQHNLLLSDVEHLIRQGLLEHVRS
eukprot:m.210774 g.210774  ORF g.210774 m.210774 type:complete len:146 (-) comp53963_c0_seq15:83-520(-)